MKSRKPGTFQVGNKAALGNRGGGRPADWLREKCQEGIKRYKLIEFLLDVAAGEYTEVIETADGIKTHIKKSADADIRLKAMNMLLDRGYGKSLQEVRPVDDQGNYAPFQIFMPAQVSGKAGTAS